MLIEGPGQSSDTSRNAAWWFRPHNGVGHAVNDQCRSGRCAGRPYKWPLPHGGQWSPRCRIPARGVECIAFSG
eukprot:UN4777